jgi:hypothetical protein
VLVPRALDTRSGQVDQDVDTFQQAVHDLRLAKVAVCHVLSVARSSGAR